MASGDTVGPTDGFVYGINNGTVLCSRGFNTTSSITCVQITTNDTQWMDLEVTKGSLTQLQDGYLGNVSEGQAFKFNNTILFCSNLSELYDVPRNIVMVSLIYKLEFTLEILTYVGCGLSIVGSCILLVTYCVLKELRTLAGKLVMNLSASILISDTVLAGLLAANSFLRSQEFCVAISILLHNTFLTRFCWMSIIAVHIAIVSTNPFSSNKSRVSEGKQCKEFLVCMMIGWCLPLVVVGTCIGLNFSPLHALVEYGGDGRCMITNRNAFLGAFVVPVSASILINVTCFTISSIAICCCMRGKTIVSNFRVFIALSSLMGVTWLCGFVAMLIDNVIPWYIFVVLNSTQGLFVFVMMLCKRRTFQLYKSLFVKNTKLKKTIIKSQSSSTELNLTTPYRIHN